MRHHGTWRLELLGTPRLTSPSGITFPCEGKGGAVLMYLALHGPASRSRIAGLLWPDATEATARNNLVQLLRRMKHAYGTDLVTATETLALSADVTVDAAWTSVPPGSPAAAPLLHGVAFADLVELDAWLGEQRQRWTDDATAHLTRTAKTLEAAGQYEAAREAARQWLTLDPTSEAAVRAVMRLHYLLGQPDEALATYASCKALLKGSFGAEPMPATRELAALIERGRTPPATEARGSAPPPGRANRVPALVGRERVWARMEAAWQARKTVFITGPPGIGKTRLAVEFARAHGELILFEARPGDRLVPYGTEGRMLRALLNHYGSAHLDAAARLVLARVVPELREDDFHLPPLRSFEEVRAFYHDVERAAAQLTAGTGDATLVVDDWQFMDEASIEFAGFNIDTPPSQKIGPVALVTYRHGELPPSAERILHRGLARGNVELIELGPLNVADVERLVESMGLPPHPSFVQQVTRYAGGNPLYVRETLAYLRDIGHPGAELPAHLSPPGVAGAVIEQRLSRLSPEALQAARAAAVLRSDFTVELVAEVLTAPLLSTASAWEELQRTGVMTGERFSHDLVLEAVAAAIPASLRRSLHLNAASTLTKRGARPGIIAHHWREAGVPARAAEWLLAAAREAEAALQVTDAAALYGAAQQAFEESGRREDAEAAAARARLTAARQAR